MIIPATTRSNFIACTVGSSVLPMIGSSAEAERFDICVYGGTASGVMAAVTAAKQRRSVVIVEPSRWLGGMTGGGLSHVDWGREKAVGGTASHIAMTSIRMEPVWMILGESAGVAASIAVAENLPVQSVDYKTLRSKLDTLKQRFDRPT